MLRVWLCRARKDTGESMASLLLAHSLTTLRPVWWIFSVSWSTAMLLGAQTSTGLWGDKSQDQQLIQLFETRKTKPCPKCLSVLLNVKKIKIRFQCLLLLYSHSNKYRLVEYWRGSYPLPCRARWYTIVAEVTVFPVPGGPWIRLRGRCSTVFTAYTCITINISRVSSDKTRHKKMS